MSALSISSMSSTTRVGAASASPERPELDVLRDVADVAVAEARVVEALHGVVDVEAVLGLGGRLDLPADQRQAERRGEVLGEQRLAGAGLAAHEQRPLEREGDVDRVPQVLGGDVASRCPGTDRRRDIGHPPTLALAEAVARDNAARTVSAD